jgi:hypothetical protein
MHRFKFEYDISYLSKKNHSCKKKHIVGLVTVFGSAL